MQRRRRERFFLPRLAGSPLRLTASPQGPPDRRPGGGRVRKGCPKQKGSLPAVPRAHLADRESRAN